MRKRSLNIAVFLTTFLSPHLFSANLLVEYDEQKEGSYSTQKGNQVQQPKQVYDYTILHHKNVNHTLEDIEEVEDDLGDNVWAINQKLIKSNSQSTPLILGAVLQHKQTQEYHQYLITSTGLLSKSTQPNAVKRAHKTRFHLIKATRGHVSLQLLEWLQISKHYIVTALYTNRPVCRNCYLIANSLWKKELKTNEKGCIEAQCSVLDKMPNLAQQYINTHLNLSLVQSLVVPMMGYVSKEEMNKAIQQKDKEMASFIASMQATKDEQITMLSNDVKTKNRQLKEKDIKYQEELKKKDQEIQSQASILELLKEQINMLNKEVNKKDKQLNDKNNTISTLNNQLKENEQKIAALQSILQNIPKQPLNDNKKKELFKAIENNNLNKVKMFLDTYKDVVNAGNEDNYQKTPFLSAAQKGQLAIAKLLRQRGANVNAKDKNNDNALHWACWSSGSVDMVTWLLDVCKIGIESKGFNQMTPFLSAANKGQLAIAKLLRQRGADINAKSNVGSNALYFACLASDSVPMVTWLLDVCKIGIETKGQYEATPFLSAAEKGQLAIAKLLRQRGADINAKDKDGKNALHEACLFSGSEAMVTWLLDVCKIGIESKGQYQMTPFLCAAKKGQLAIAKLLRQRGADINAKDEDRSNALHWACFFSGSEAMVTWLLDVCKIGIETKGNKQKTPFLSAAKKGQLAIAKLLRQRGADIHAKDKNGKNALYYAKKYSNSEAMINYLKELGLT